MRRRICKALTEDPLIIGCARTPFLLNVMLAACLLFINYKLLFLPAILYFVIRKASKKDPKFLDILKRMFQYKKRYDS